MKNVSFHKWIVIWAMIIVTVWIVCLVILLGNSFPQNQPVNTVSSNYTCDIDATSDGAGNGKIRFDIGDKRYLLEATQKQVDSLNSQMNDQNI